MLFQKFYVKQTTLSSLQQISRVVVLKIKHFGDFSRVNEILQDLGPTFVKFGQILSTRTDLLPAELCAQLSTLQDQVKPITYEEVSQVIQEEFGAQIEDLFSYFSESPLACASIAQVHTAKINF